MVNGVLYLHGVGEHTTDAAWRGGLEQALEDLGYPGLDAVDAVCAPTYSKLLAPGAVLKAPMPRRVTEPKGDRLRRRREYELGQGSLRRLLGVDDEVDGARGVYSGFPDGVTDRSNEAFRALVPVLRQAGRYMRNANLRATILDTVLEALPDVDELVIIGHSLGSLVAIDLLDHLPARVTVRRLVTVGSPAGMPVVHENSDRLLKEFPYGQVRSWLNVLSPLDIVTAGRGLTSLFPAAHDARVDLPLHVHRAEAYLRQPMVALAIGEALFGSLSREVGPPAGPPVEGLTTIEAQALFSIAFAHMTLNEMAKSSAESASRYGEALKVVQEVVLDTLSSMARQQGRNVSNDVLGLESQEAPPCPRAWTFEEAVRLLIITATTNLVAPWEIAAHRPAVDGRVG